MCLVSTKASENFAKKIIRICFVGETSRLINMKARGRHVHIYIHIHTYDNTLKRIRIPCRRYGHAVANKTYIWIL